ncbi:MAG: hypothetical protein GF331_11525 [Chitinivibrionales bacterium]|nr:hypothetical protein [Chitinivibrionales bacterium]
MTRPWLAVVAVVICALLCCDSDENSGTAPPTGPTTVRCYVVNAANTTYGIISAYDTTSESGHEKIDTSLCSGGDTLEVAWCSSNQPDSAPSSFVIALIVFDNTFSYIVSGIGLDDDRWVRVGDNWYHTIEAPLAPCCQDHEYEAAFEGEWRVEGARHQPDSGDSCLYIDSISGLCVVSAFEDEIYGFGAPMYVRYPSPCIRFSNGGISCRPTQPDPVKYWFTRSDSIYLGRSWMPSNDPADFDAYRYQPAVDAVRLLGAADTLVFLLIERY